MHECPICGQTCDCDGEDTWFSYPYNLDCTCNCEEERDADEDDLMPDDDDLEEMSQAVTRADELRIGADDAGHGAELCDCSEPFPKSGYCKFCGAHSRYAP